MTTTTHHPTAVAEFAAAVRAHLADLPGDELDELTDGLLADLAERAAESGDPDLGDPAAYAEELRAAAGYPPHDARSHRGGVLPDLAPLRRSARRRLQELRENRVAAAVVDFLIALRPVWWVFRGWAIGVWISGVAFGDTQALPQSLAQWVLLLAFIVVSVQFGRGRWLPRRWMRRGLLIVNVAMIVATPFILGWVGSSYQSMRWAYEAGTEISPGSLNIGGAPIDNIFAYDEDGEPIDRVQLFDQDGRPLDLVANTQEPFWGTMNGQMVVPSTDAPGRVGWNVYPLDQAAWNAYEDDGWITDDEAFASEFPSIRVKPLAERGTDAAGPGDGPFAATEPTPMTSPAP